MGLEYGGSTITFESHKKKLFSLIKKKTKPDIENIRSSFARLALVENKAAFKPTVFKWVIFGFGKYE